MTYEGPPYWPPEYDYDTSCPGDCVPNITGCDDCPFLGTDKCPYGFRPTSVGADARHDAAIDDERAAPLKRL